MSTRSRIARLNNDGSISSIYCHFDGYPAGVGRTLLDHYTTQERVNGLISLGDLSVLGKSIGQRHDFESARGNDMCVAYGRDRGEVDVGAVHSVNHAALMDLVKNSWEEYVYLFDGEWSYLRVRDDGKFQPLTQEVCED
mgnify:CR=1 FL=1